MFVGKGGHVKIYPAPEDAYTHGAWEILIDIEDEVNSWGVRHSLFDSCSCSGGVLLPSSLTKSNHSGIRQEHALRCSYLQTLALSSSLFAGNAHLRCKMDNVYSPGEQATHCAVGMSIESF